MRRAAALALLPLLLVPAAAPAKDYRYEVPVEQDSPWPSMRRDRRNTGASPIVGRYRGDRPWAFRTGKGIFSTPVLGGDGTAYVGSADRSFYAIAGAGHERWRFRTGEIIDSAATLTPDAVTVGSGDEYLYRLRTDARPLSPGARTLWRYRASRPPATGQLVNWWEGNAVTGFGGTIFAGNTGGGRTRSPLEAGGAGSSRRATRCGRRPRSRATGAPSGARSTSACTGSTRGAAGCGARRRWAS